MNVELEDPCRRLLSHVALSRLEEWADEASVPVPPTGGAHALVEALLSAPSFSFTAAGVLRRMSVPELGLVCRELGGMGNSTDRARLEERILALLDVRDAVLDPESDVRPLSAPVTVWLEGRRTRAARRAERRRIADHATITHLVRGAIWGIVFAALARFGVFRHTSDALVLGFGVTLLAGTIYRIQLGLTPSLLLGALEVGVRLFVIGIGPAMISTLALLTVAELISTGAMSVDAESARSAQTTFAFRAPRRERPDPDRAAPAEALSDDSTAEPREP